MRRLTWFVTGAATGALSAGYARKKIKQTASQISPTQVARSGAVVVRRRGRDLVDALREGRDAMHDREDELRARRDGRLASLDDQLDPGDVVFIDGRRVDPDRVVVVRDN